MENGIQGVKERANALRVLRMLKDSISMKTFIITMFMAVLVTSVFASEMTLLMGKPSRFIEDMRGHTSIFVGGLQVTAIHRSRGLVFYDVSNTNTHPGNIKYTQNGQTIVVPSDRRWSRAAYHTLFDIPVQIENGVTIEGVFYPFSQMRQFWYHVNDRNIPNPSPYVYKEGERSITFMHEGSVITGPINQYVLQNPHLVDNEIINYLTTGFNNDPDPSGLIFAVLLMHIKEANWDIGRGISNALGKNGIWTLSVINFILSDGYETFAYRSKQSMLYPTHGLYYTLDIPQNRVATITSRDRGYDIALELDELLYLPVHGEPTRFKEFSTNQKMMVRSYQEGWNWHSTPVLCVNQIEQNHHVILDAYPDISQIEYADGYAFLIPPNTWVTDKVRLAHPNLGMRIETTADGIAYLEGELLPIEPYDGDFNPSIGGVHGSGVYWVTYNLLQEQSVYAALGPLVSQIEWVKSQNWTVNIKPNLDADRLNSRPMIFGMTYDIKVREDVDPIVNFQWTNSRIRPLSDIVRAGEYFIFTNQNTYEAIDILEIGQQIANYKEIGVFVDDVCVGSVLVDEFPLQVLIYTKGFEGMPLTFKALQMDEETIDIIDPLVEIFDENSRNYQHEQLVAGSVGHVTVRMNLYDNSN
ncbi:MAG: hypothetical protein FWG98_04495 [Candidatus Cloacimonetes bacterium]|nr:hypothetical protein [Candidatus Cloacimonadota bacterium]